MKERLATGIGGLDEVLCGGLIPGRSYMACGGPGSGKTTLGLHFLTADRENDPGERLLITLEEPEAHIRYNAAATGFDLESVSFLDLSPGPEFFAQTRSYDIFSPAEVEREPTTQKITHRVRELKPSRVFLEVVTQFRYLSEDTFQFHRQMLSFLRFLIEQGATVLFTSEASRATPDDDLQFLADGVIRLERNGFCRTVETIKCRGSDYRPGPHTMRLTDHGMEVFPRLLPEEHGRIFTHETISSGVPKLDTLLGGGLERGTVTILTGPSGAGKTSIGMQFLETSALRGERAVLYAFDESSEMLMARSEQIGMPIRDLAAQGALSIVEIEPLRYSPDEFAHLVRGEVDAANARVVMLDSISGFKLCIHGENLARHLHALCEYLRNMGVTVLLANEQEWLTGEFRATESGISFLTDNLIFLRYLEIEGHLNKAIGVLKKRLSDFEKTLRRFEITEHGIEVGPPLQGLTGVLRGNPHPAGRRMLVPA